MEGATTARKANSILNGCNFLFIFFCKNGLNPFYINSTFRTTINIIYSKGLDELPKCLTLLPSEWPNLYGVLAVLSEIGLKKQAPYDLFIIIVQSNLLKVTKLGKSQSLSHNHFLSSFSLKTCSSTALPAWCEADLVRSNSICTGKKHKPYIEINTPLVQNMGNISQESFKSNKRMCADSLYDLHVLREIFPIF